MAVHYFLVCPILPLLTLVAVEALQYGRRGSETTLVPQIRGPPDAILWKQASRKVVEFDGSEESVHGTFQDRVVLDWHTASLTIKDLRETDSGPYELEATINKKKYYSQHEVAVIDKVEVPTISCLINGTVSGVGESDPPRSRGFLRCSAEGPPSLITYHWTPLDGVTVGGAGLTVALAGDQDETVYTCRATNPVSQEMGTFVARDCYPDSFSPGWIIAIVVLCLLVLLSAGCFLGYWRWSKAHPEADGIEDMESQPLNRSNGSGNTKAYDKDNGATLPSSQRLALLSPPDPAVAPGGLEEDHTAHSGGGGDSTRVSVHSSESRLPELQQPSELESKLSAGDSAVGVLVEPGLESESHPPPTASPVGRGSLHVATETEATQTRPHRDSLSASSLEDLQSSSLETTHPPAKACPSPGRPDNHSDSDITSPQQMTLRDGHLGSDEDGHLGSDEDGHLGSDEDGHLGSAEGSQAAHADLYESDPEAPEPAAVIPREKEEEEEAASFAPLGSLGSSSSEEEEEEEEDEEGDAAALDPLSILGSSEAEREKEKLEAAALAPLSHLASSEEEEEERTDTGPACVSPGDERGGERLVAAGDPPVNLEMLPSEMKEAVTDAEAPHGAEVLQEEGEVEEDDDDREEEGPGVSSPEQARPPECHSDSEAAAGERGTDRREEDKEETSHTTEDKHEDPKDGAGQAASPIEPNLEVMERREEEENNDVPETACDDPQGPEEDEGEDRGVASSPASEPEPHRGSEVGVVEEEEEEESDTNRSMEEEKVQTPEDKRDNAGDAAGQVEPPAEPTVETSERKRDVPLPSPDDTEGPEEGEVEQKDGKDIGGASLPASRPETHRDSEAVAGEGNTDGRVKEETLEGKEEEHDVPQTVDDDVDVQKEEGGREGEQTGLTEMESRPETGPDPDREPGESGAVRGETPGSGGQHEERKEVRNGRLPANQDAEAERRDGDKEAENEDSTE